MHLNSQRCDFTYRDHEAQRIEIPRRRNLNRRESNASRSMRSIRRNTMHLVAILAHSRTETLFTGRRLRNRDFTVFLSFFRPLKLNRSRTLATMRNRVLRQRASFCAPLGSTNSLASPFYSLNLFCFYISLLRSNVNYFFLTLNFFIFHPLQPDSFLFVIVLQSLGI